MMTKAQKIKEYLEANELREKKIGLINDEVKSLAASNSEIRRIAASILKLQIIEFKLKGLLTDYAELVEKQTEEKKDLEGRTLGDLKDLAKNKRFFGAVFLAGLGDLNRTRRILVHHLVDSSSTLKELSANAADSLNLAVSVEGMFPSEEERIYDKIILQHKSLKFRSELVELILSNNKYSTWRLFDEKNIQVDDEIELREFATDTIFALAKVTKVVDKPLGKLNKEDKKGHEGFKTDEEMYATYSGYYKTEVTPETPVKIIWFKLKDK